jgi:hypothetical protein
MNEIDLFPDELRKKLLFYRWFKMTGIAIVLMTLISGAGFATLREVNAGIDEQIRVFQSQREISDSNRQRLKQLNQEKRDLQQQLSLLDGLRSGASAEQMFVTIDRALPGPKVWLTNWRFRRAGTRVDAEDNTVSTGYFVVVPAGSESSEEETWKIETKMEIQGQALDHVAMSQFVLNLTQQPEIENVRIVSSRQMTVNQAKLVEFGLDIVVSGYREQG